MELFKFSSASVSDDVIGKQVLSANSHKDIVNRFVDLYANSLSREADKCVTSMLSSHFGASMARPIKYLLDHVDDATRKCFASTYLDPMGMGFRASATVVVKHVADSQRTSRNRGLFSIAIRTTDGRELDVKFANQVSLVYYLMFIIDRYHKQYIDLSHLELANNLQAFARLYHAVYDDISHDEVLRRRNSLLYREVNGRLRPGRENQVIYDIRRTLSKVFKDLDESFFPYAMTAQTHLGLRPDKIVFEGEARRLLYFEFH